MGNESPIWCDDDVCDDDVFDLVNCMKTGWSRPRGLYTSSSSSSFFELDIKSLDSDTDLQGGTGLCCSS